MHCKGRDKSDLERAVEEQVLRSKYEEGVLQTPLEDLAEESLSYNSGQFDVLYMDSIRRSFFSGYDIELLVKGTTADITKLEEYLCRHSQIQQAREIRRAVLNCSTQEECYVFTNQFKEHLEWFTKRRHPDVEIVVSVCNSYGDVSFRDELGYKKYKTGIVKSNIRVVADGPVSAILDLQEYIQSSAEAYKIALRGLSLSPRVLNKIRNPIVPTRDGVC